MGSMSLDPSIWQLLVVLLIMLMGGCIGVITYFLKDIRMQLKDKLSSQDARIDEVKEDLIALEKSLPRTYLHRDDWMRDQNIMDKRLEEMKDKVTEMNQNLLKLIGSGGRS